MSLDQQVASLVKASNDLTGAVDGKIGQIDRRMAEAESRFDAWRQIKDVVGDPGGYGTMRMSVFQGFIHDTGGATGQGGAGAGDFYGKIDSLGTNSKVYVHFRTPLNINKNNEMFWFNLRGYGYGSASIIDEIFVGYCYENNLKLTNEAAFGNRSPAVYVDTNGNVLLRILLPSSYYATMRMDTMRVGNGRLYAPGDFDVKVSLADTVVFN